MFCFVDTHRRHAPLFISETEEDWMGAKGVEGRCGKGMGAGRETVVGM